MVLWLILLIVAITGVLWALNADGHLTKWRARRKKQERSVYVTCSMCGTSNSISKVWFQQAAARYRLSESVRDVSCDECGADMSSDVLKHPFVKDLHGRIASHRMQRSVAEEMLNLSSAEEEVARADQPPEKVRS